MLDVIYGEYMLIEKVLEHFCKNNKDINIEDCVLEMDMNHNIRYIHIDKCINFEEYQKKVIFND